ncbi:MAG: hypothetical protein KY453_04075 [Gemmatimonadetes bacterium]|nr:hypothetical protein [Gemmatimonadota bacterium]
MTAGGRWARRFRALPDVIVRRAVAAWNRTVRESRALAGRVYDLDRVVDAPSPRFRLAQFREPLARRGLVMEEHAFFPPDALPYLEELASALSDVSRSVPFQLVVVADRRPAGLGGLPWSFVPWSPEAEMETLHRMDLVRLLEDPAARHALGRAGRPWVEERYSVEAAAPAIAHYLRVAAGSARRAGS